MSKLKVLYLTNIPSPYRVSFFEELGENCDLTVLFERETVDYRNKEWLDFTAQHFTAKFLKGIKRGNRIIAYDIFKYLKKDKYDVIIVGGYSTLTGMMAIEFLKLKKIPFYLNADGGLIKKDPIFIKKIKCRLISAANGWLSTGINTTDYLVNYGANKQFIYTYPFTSIQVKDVLDTPLNFEEKKRIRNELGIIEDKVVLSVGQFIQRKGFDILLKSAESVQNDIGIYIIGGEPTEEFIKLREKLKLDNIHFIGFTNKKELLEFYKAADIFVLPTREDIWGLVINEAMANGLPVITTDKCVAGLEMIKSGENGFIVPIDDSETIAEKINFLFNSEKIIEKMSVESIKTAKKYTIEQMAQKHIEILNSKDNLM